MNLKLIAGNYGRTLKKEKKLKWPYQKIFSQSINFPSYSSVTLLKKKRKKWMSFTVKEAFGQYKTTAKEDENDRLFFFKSVY